tara:strand:+ start:137 stop:424 length:288 start_codon:yes stop_codon:yes gene_type:complete
MHYDGEKEIINGQWNGLVWSDKYKDFVYPNLDELKDSVQDDAKKGLEICYTCDSWKPGTRQCKECGCFMDVKRIALRLVEKSLRKEFKACPLGKW